VALPSSVLGRCRSNNGDGIAEEEAEDSMVANEQARNDACETNAPSSSNDGSLTPDWDESIYGDAKRSCTCGYADGLFSYCACQ
jgi:hypothetical protein